MPPPGGARTPLSGIVTWLTSLGRGKPTKTNNAAEKPVDVNQFKEMPSSLTTGSSGQTCRELREAVAQWGQAADPDEATTQPLRRLPCDATFQRVRAYLRGVMEEPVFTRPGQEPGDRR